MCTKTTFLSGDQVTRDYSILIPGIPTVFKKALSSLPNILTCVFLSTVVGMEARVWFEQSTVILESLHMHWHFLGQVLAASPPGSSDGLGRQANTSRVKNNPVHVVRLCLVDAT